MERVEKWEGDKENWERRNCNQNIIYEKNLFQLKIIYFTRGKKEKVKHSKWFGERWLCH